jgi:hypothetical protein
MLVLLEEKMRKGVTYGQAQGWLQHVLVCKLWTQVLKDPILVHKISRQKILNTNMLEVYFQFTTYIIPPSSEIKQ